VHSLGPFSQEGPLNERGVKKKGKAFSSFVLRQSVIRTSSLSRYIPPPSCPRIKSGAGLPFDQRHKPAHKGADGNLKNKHFSCPAAAPLQGRHVRQGKGAIARKGMFTRMIFEGRLTRDKVRRKAEFSSPSYFVNRSFVLRNSPGDEVRRKSEFSSPSHFVNPPFVLRHSPRADQRKGC
jgi:hypothetical protein